MKTKLTLLAFLFVLVQVRAQDFIQSPFQSLLFGSPVLADFNGDDKIDVLGIQFFFNPPTPLSLQINTSDSMTIQFTDQDFGFTIDATGQPGVADFDGDQDIDILVPRRADRKLLVLRNDGNANFTLDSFDIIGPRILQVVDIDNNGSPDILGIDTENDALELYVNDGNENFINVTIINNASGLRHFEAADLDDDNDLDIAVGFDRFTGDQLVVYENQGGNNFVANIIASGSFSGMEDLRVDDIDSDGKKDIIAIRSRSCVSFLNEGSFSFEQKELFTRNAILRQVEVGDYDGDGKKDIILGSNSEGITYHRNLSNSTLEFDMATEISSISPSFTIINGDLNQDGALDLVISNGEFWWLENNIEQISVSTLDLEFSQISIFPNPFNGILQIKNRPAELDFLSLTDLNGRIIFSSVITSDQVDLSHLHTGHYFMTLKSTVDRTIQRSILVVKQ